MAEAELFSLAKSLGKLILSEAKFLYGVEGQVSQAKIKLEIMSASLEDADAHVRNGNKTVRLWVSKLREESYDLEDVIQTYVSNASGGGIKVVLKGIHLHKIGKRIEEIVSNIHDWTSELQNCGLLQRSLDQAAETSSKRAEEQRELRRTHSHVVDNDVVGFDKHIEELVALLTEKENNKHRHGVISVCGMGGLGKTTLARKVYHHPRVRDHFDCFAWASITQQCVVREIWEGILFGLISPNTKEKREEIRSMSDGEMSKELYKLQKEKKCLVLLDDIWTTSTWDCLKDAFPEEETKSKILLTTRKPVVALHVDARCFIHELHYLNENESWKLFQNKVREYPTDSINKERMEVVGREMVGHCSGLPLAIIMLSGLLSEKQTVKEWEDMKGNVMKCIAESNRKDDDSQKNGLWVLGLSYDELPFYMKPCFLYLAHYPEDATIRVKELCRMLVAESFIAPSEMNSTKAIEDVAYDCLNEFVKRSMIQVENWGSTGRMKTFRIHDLMRKFCLSKGRDDLFMQFVDLRNKAEEALQSVSDTIRRVVIYTTCDDSHSIKFFLKANKSLRCLVVDVRKERIIEPMLVRVSSFLMLRVLNLSLYMSPSSNRELPKEIGQLIHLRWFKIRCGFFMKIPSSIGNLRWLQTFKLDAEVVNFWEAEWKIPNVLWKWEQLRHLCLPNPYGLASSKWLWSSKWLRLPNPRNLQTLEGVRTKYLTMDDFLLLINLKKLKIYVEKDWERIYHDPENNKFPFLESLQVFSINERFRMEIVPIILSYPRIYKLKIMHVPLVKLPKVSQFSPNLMKLALKETFLEDDPMPTLEKLPNLRVLCFYYGSFVGGEMVCSKGGFPLLESLHFESLHSGYDGLNEWKVEKGALSSLRFLVINCCKRLRGVSDGLRYITTLKEMKIQTMPREFKTRLENGGDDFYKVQHVPSRIFSNCN